MNQALLKQGRDMIQRQIEENPAVFIAFNQPIVENSEGIETEDPFGVPVSITCRGRLFLSSDNLGSYLPSMAGLVPAEIPFLLVNYTTTGIKENAVYEINANRYIIKKINPIRRFNGIIGYVCPLKEGTELAQDT